MFVKRATGACVLERTEPPLHPGDVVRSVAWEEMTPPHAVAWLEANGYTAIPATLHRAAKTGKGAKRDAPKKRKR